jgi:hypothetical protein
MAPIVGPVLTEPTTDVMTDGDVVEIPVLLPGWQALALEDVAHHSGLTAGEMLRLLLADFLANRLCSGKARQTNHTGPQADWS